MSTSTISLNYNSENNNKLKKEKKKNLNKKSKVEDKYKKLTQREHILVRPDTYIGSIEIEENSYYILSEDGKKFMEKKLMIVPGLLKIFDEVIVNAADNFRRDPSTSEIRVSICPDTHRIKVYNTGKGIPIIEHKEYKMLVPELIFGELLTSSNYDDGEKKITGGRNGFGAKLTNIYSKEFIVRTGDSKERKKCEIIWKDNMTVKSSPVITNNCKTSFTEVEFCPDLNKFSVSQFGDHIKLFEKRVWDLKGCLGNKIKIYYNDAEVKLSGFKDYCKMYMEDNEELYSDNIKSDRWEVQIGLSDGEFVQVSFVNSICTLRGGSHVMYITDQITKLLIEQIKKKHKKINLKPSFLKNHLKVFVNCLIENPSFESQTKEILKTKPSEFGSKYEITSNLINKLMATNLVEKILFMYEKKEILKMQKELKGSKRERLSGIPKLEDANLAGTKNSNNCTLILTEGDSAKTLAMAGIQIVGRDYYGVFPLRGKFINIRESNNKEIMNNKEVSSIIKIIGLKVGANYESTAGLRYGSVMIMADQDNDGSHIKGLVINFFHYFWPTLIRLNTFIRQFITPLIKCIKGKEKYSFFSNNDFQNFKNTHDIKKFYIKYYKGLGTSSNKEAEEYFSQIDVHKKDFIWVDNEDDEAIDLVFNKKKADIRKEWLAEADINATIDHTGTTVRYITFINKEFVHFSIANNLRAIPSMCDGLKPGQRKILFSCFKRKLVKEIKVAQLSGYVAEHSAYHHGEVSLQDTIIKMAQNYVGSNNINLLNPNGQFGSRYLGGKDHASARYVYTNLNKLTRYIFKEEDDHILDYLEDDGLYVEPFYYVPIIPMILVNGGCGIGTGWSSEILNYNPREIIDILLQMIDNIDYQLQRLSPFYKNYLGEIICEYNKGQVTYKGIFELDKDNNILYINELPIKKWTYDFKKKLEKYVEEKKYIIDYKEYHTTNHVKFEIELQSEFSKKATEQDIIKYFFLEAKESLNNMVLFNNEGKIYKYKTEADIIKDFYNVRINAYEKRKKYLISEVKRRNEILKNKMKFIECVISERLVIKNKKKAAIAEEMDSLNFTKYSKLPKIESNLLNISEQNKKSLGEKEDREEGGSDAEKSEADDGAVVDNKNSNSNEYNYILTMNFWSLSQENITKLKEELLKNNKELEDIINKPIKQIWKEELLELLSKMLEIEEKERRDIENQDKVKQKMNNKNNNKNKKKQKQKKVKQTEDNSNNNNKKNVKKEKKVEKKQPIYLKYIDRLSFLPQSFLEELKGYYSEDELLAIEDEDSLPLAVKQLRKIILEERNNS